MNMNIPERFALVLQQIFSIKSKLQNLGETQEEGQVLGHTSRVFPKTIFPILHDKTPEKEMQREEVEVMKEPTNLADKSTNKANGTVSNGDQIIES